MVTISLGMALLAGNRRVPRPATGITAVLTLFIRISFHSVKNLNVQMQISSQFTSKERSGQVSVKYQGAVCLNGFQPGFENPETSPTAALFR
jgi:hypothetical protein